MTNDIGQPGPGGGFLHHCLGEERVRVLARLLDSLSRACIQPSPQLGAVDLGVELHRQVPPDRERLHPDLVAGQDLRLR